MTRNAAIPPLLKDLNQRTVLETIRASAPVSRAEISRMVGISKPTVSLAAALVLGFDLGARFHRGAICDLRGKTRARQDVEVMGSDAENVLDVIASLRLRLVEAAGLADDLIDSVVVGVPGVVDAETGQIDLATSVPGLEGVTFRTALSDRLDLPVTLENDVNLAALGEHWQGVARGVDDFVFLSIGTGMGAGLVLNGELHRGHHGAAGEVDFALVGLGQDVDPCAGAISAYAARLVAERGAATDTMLRQPFDARAIFAAARAGDALAQDIVDEVARPNALHVVPIAAVTDVPLAVLGGGLGANGDLLLRPVRELLGSWIPYPPQVDVSSLGEAAVLTGALAIGLRTALDNVFVERPRRAS